MSKSSKKTPDSSSHDSKAKRPVPVPGSQRHGLIAFLVLLAVLIGSHIYDAYNKPEVRNLTQKEFREAVIGGKVLDVSRVKETDSPVSFFVGKLAGMNGEAPADFRVSLIPGENEGLVKFLDDHGVNVKIVEKAPLIGPFFQQLFLFVLPMLFLFWFFFYRKMGNGMNPFSIGKSKARLLNEDGGGKHVTFGDVAGIDEAKEEVQEIVEFLKEPERFAKLGGRIPKGVLLVGPPGTGKTLLARAISGEAKVPFFSISGSDFEEMFVGVGASRVRDMFDQAKKNSPCLVFIDEIDAVGHKRSEGMATQGRAANEQTLNAMLVEMDGFDANEGVIIIAATNRPDVLDPALLRPGRFDRQIYVDLPTLKGREEIIRLHGQKIKFAEGVDLRRLARGTPGFSGADLANVLNEAALLAVRKGLSGVDEETLDEARDKVLWGRERKSAGYTKRERETTAWHESGHALLQLLLENTDPLHKVTIIPRGRALGATMSLPDHDVLNRTRNQFLDELVVLAGGRVAEEMFTGDISTGAAQDIREATRIARNMVCRYAMSGTFGFRSFNDTNPFTVEEAMPSISEKTSQAIDEEVGKLVDDAYAKAKKLLQANRGRLELLASKLVEKESMDGRDIEELVGVHKRHGEEKNDTAESTSHDSDNLHAEITVK